MKYSRGFTSNRNLLWLMLQSILSLAKILIVLLLYVCLQISNYLRISVLTTKRAQSVAGTNDYSYQHPATIFISY